MSLALYMVNVIKGLVAGCVKLKQCQVWHDKISTVSEIFYLSFSVYSHSSAPSHKQFSIILNNESRSCCLNQILVGLRWPFISETSSQIRHFQTIIF